MGLTDIRHGSSVISEECFPYFSYFLNRCFLLKDHTYIMDECIQSNPILLVLNISADLTINILNALKILWENHFDQTALMLIIHSYHKAIWHLVLSQKPNIKRRIKRFKGNCLFQILALASRRCLSPPRRWGIPSKTKLSILSSPFSSNLRCEHVSIQIISISPKSQCGNSHSRW